MHLHRGYRDDVWAFIGETKGDLWIIESGCLVHETRVIFCFIQFSEGEKDFGRLVWSMSLGYLFSTLPFSLSKHVHGG